MNMNLTPNAITLDALRALDAIDTHGSFAAAAEALHKVPSALTYTIKKLEEDIEVPLFDRSQHRARLTPAGQMALEQGREILKASQRMVESVRQLESGWESHLRIARDTVIPSAPVLQAVKDFQQLGHPLDMTLTVESLGGGWDALYSQRADIAIGVDGNLPKGVFKTVKMAYIHFAFVVASDHPLASFDGVLSPEQVNEYPAIVIPDSAQSLPGRNAGLFSNQHIIRVDNFHSKLQAQTLGIGVGFLPKYLIREQLRSGTLIEKEFQFPIPGAMMYIAWRANQQGKALSWFIERFSGLNWEEILKE